jgi:hypothetical protein
VLPGVIRCFRFLWLIVRFALAPPLLPLAWNERRARPLAFLCFSLLALGKIEVIVILICNAVVNVQVRNP